MEADTITAVVTPAGEGGVGIVRASGPLAALLPAQLFPGLAQSWPSHRMRQSAIIDPFTGATVDHALGCLMRSPRSYTGEDVFEIHCHGSPLVLTRVLQLCLRLGCRAARPGEFTLRAFLNGRMDLSQAEAVIDVVRARSNTGLELAVQQLEGWLTARVEPIRQRLLALLAHTEAMVDFVEDDIPPQLDDATRDGLTDSLAGLETLLAGTREGIVLREGLTLAIVGGPNVGKSSILNALLGSDRSIVTPVAGTTRDTIEESIDLGGIPFRLVDTAGITPTEDVVERIGIERSRQAIDLSDVILLVFDRSRPVSQQDIMTLDLVCSAARTAGERGRHPRIVVALNKSDLPSRLERPALALPAEFDAVVETNTVAIDGLNPLREAVNQMITGERRDEAVAGNVRHADVLERGITALRLALNGWEKGFPLDLIATDVRIAVQCLSEIAGFEVDEEILERIFRTFCIGK